MTDIFVRISDSKGNWTSKPIETLTDEELEQYIADCKMARRDGWDYVRRLVLWFREHL